MTISLALSGGGTRAAIFHLGVLRRLALANLLEEVSCLSTVSGGSIAAALIFSYSDNRWPSSEEFLTKVFPSLQKLLTTTDLFSFAAITATPAVWRHLLFNRARAISLLLQKRWGIQGQLDQLPNSPTWYINATSMETGKNWRFSRNHMGDWKYGHHYHPPFSIADAVAASAAVPYVIGALRLPMPKDKWYRIDPATDKPLDDIPRMYETVSLWDGGAYENLGIEALWKQDRGLLQGQYLMVSDASAPLRMGRPPSPLSIFKGKLASPRLFDIASDQVRSLRSRMVSQAFSSGVVLGAIIRLGKSVRDIDLQAGVTRSLSEYALFQDDAQSALALDYPTDLARIKPELFLSLTRHGFEVADATLSAYCKPLAPQSYTWTDR